jgi:hypothetical protein
MKTLFNYYVIFLMLFSMSCRKNADAFVEPMAVPIYSLEFTQNGNYKTVQRKLTFGEGTLLKGYNGKILFSNEDLLNTSYIFETEGSLNRLDLVLRIKENGSSETTQFGLKIFKNGKQIINVSHTASGNATKDHRISI